MSVVDTLRTASGKIVDSSSVSVPIDFYYGDIATWITVNLSDQANDFIWIDPIDGSIPEAATGFIREDYTVKIVYGRVCDKDLSKDEIEAIIWDDLRPRALQYIDKIFKETNTNGAKLFMPREDGSIEEYRRFSANNVYGVLGTVTVKERYPSETC